MRKISFIILCHNKILIYALASGDKRTINLGTKRKKDNNNKIGI